MSNLVSAVAAEPLTFSLAIAALVLFAAHRSLLDTLRDRLDRRRAARGRRNLDLPVLDEMPRHAASDALVARAEAARDARDAEAMSRLLTETTADIRTMPDGGRNYDIALFTLIEPIWRADGLVEMAGLLAGYRELHEAQPEDEALLGLYLRALQAAAWRARGTDEGRDPTPEGMQAFVLWMAAIEDAVRAARVDPAASVLLAEPWYHAAMLGEDPARQLTMRFELVVAADPGNFRLWAERAHHLLPGWFGTVSEIGAHMERAIRATRSDYGESVMTNIVATVMHCIDVHDLPGYSDARLAGAIADLATEPSAQEDLNMFAALLFGCGWRGLPERIMRRHITAIYAPAWRDETHYLALFDRAFGGKPSGRVAPPDAAVLPLAAE